MKHFFSFCVLIFAACFWGCGPGTGFEISSLNPVSDISAPAPATALEMYSWHNGQNWAYAMFESATKVPAYADITTSSDIIIGTDEMVSRLVSLGRGTKVYWNLKPIKGFALPDKPVLQKISQEAALAGIELEIIAWP